MRITESLKYNTLLILISPALGLYHAVRGLGWQSRRWSLILLVTLFGATMYIPEEADASRFQQNVYDHYLNLSFNQWSYELYKTLMFSPEPGTKGDVYIHILSYLAGAVLGLPGIFFTLVSFIFGYFYINGLYKVFRGEYKIKITFLFLFLSIIFIIFNGVDSLQTVRTWTGAWVLFNGVLGFHQTGKKKYLLLMLAAPLFHVAYFAMALPAYAVIFIKKLSPKFFILAFFISFFITINPEGIIKQLQTTDIGADKVQGYYRPDDDASLDMMQQNNKNWYTTYGKGPSRYWGTNALAFCLILFGLFSKRKMTSLEIGLFSTGLLMITFANLMDFIDAVYNRTMVNAGVYILATVVLLLIRGELLKAKGTQLFFRKLMLWISVGIFIPQIVYTLANMLQFTSIFMVATPFMRWFFGEGNISLREFIRFFFL